MNKLLLIFLSLFFVNLINAQPVSLQWADQLSGAADEEGTSVAVDIYGNVYTMGNFRGSVDFDPGPGDHILSAEGIISFPQRVVLTFSY